MRHRAIFCGLFAAFAVYSSYVYTAGTETGHIAPMTDAERRGAEVFQQYNCVACHQFYGLGGYMGPDLTNVISNRGAGYARAFIMAGTAAMPNLGLATDEIDAVIAYLAFVDKTGRYPAENYDVQWTGSVAYQDDPQ